MKTLEDCKEEIHSCSKCGLCQSVCPIYKITGNDCTVSRGHFIMLRGLLKGELKMSKVINRYLEMCLKCGACTKFCPSGIDVVDIVALAKAEYFKSHFVEKFISWIEKTFIFGMGLKILSLFNQKCKSKTFDKKVIYFGGCGTKARSIKSVVKFMNSLGIEVITPDFDCCGLPFFVRGDMESFEQYAKSFFSKMKAQGITDIVTNCASCEKTIKSYQKWFDTQDYSVKNIFAYLRENNIKPVLKRKLKVTYHKPCNLANFEDVEWILNNTENLEYVQMDNYDECCGLNGLSKWQEFKTMLKLYFKKHKNILKSGSKIVLTSCLGCEMILSLFSLFQYKVQDFTDFLWKNSK